MNFGTFSGIPISEAPWLTVWERRPILPKTKNKRIRKKWRRKYPQGVNVPLDEVHYFEPSGFLMHPEVARQLKERVERGEWSIGDSPPSDFKTYEFNAFQKPDFKTFDFTCPSQPFIFRSSFWPTWTYFAPQRHVLIDC